MKPRYGYLTPPRTLPDGRVLEVAPLTFGRARLIVSSALSAFGPYDGW